MKIDLFKLGYLGGLMFVVLLVTVVIFGPLLVVWSLNTLFPVLSIEYSIWTWLAVIILFGAVRTNVVHDRKN